MDIFAEFISEYIVLVVMLICGFVGYIIKHSIPAIPNRAIPWIVGILGIILNCWENNFAFTPQILLGGLASGWAATGGFESIKNFFNKS